MKNSTIVGCFVWAFLFDSYDARVQASPVEFSFTGSGSGGSTASGSFFVDGNSLVPEYYAAGGIYPSISLTFSNIPGGGPASVSFDSLDIASTLLKVDPSGGVYVGPYGSHGFGAPEQNHYDLSPSQPFLPASYAFQSTLTYNGFLRDTITWSIATPVALPEPGSAVLLLTAMAVGGWAVRRRLRHDESAAKP